MDEVVNASAEAVAPSAAGVAGAGTAATGSDTAPETEAAPHRAAPKIRRGIGAALGALRESGDRMSEVVEGRASDTKLRDDINRPGDLVRLEYRNEEGRLLTIEEAFRMQQYQLRGQAPSARRREQRAEQLRREEAIRNASSGDTPLGIASTMAQLQARSGTAGVVLSKR